MNTHTCGCTWPSRRAKPRIAILSLACFVTLLVHSAIGAKTFADNVELTTASMPDAGTPPAPSVKEVASPVVASQHEVPPASSNDSSLPSGFVRGNVEPVPSVRELSVQPEAKPLLPADRPAWVGASPDLSTRNHRLFVGSYPTGSPDDADEALDEPLIAAVNGYIDETVLDNGGAQKLHVTADFVRNNLIDRSTEYMAELSTSQGALYQKWVVLQITPEQRQHFLSLHRQIEQQHRLVGLGAGLLGLVSLTAVAKLVLSRRRSDLSSSPLPGTVSLVHEDPPTVAETRKRRSGKMWFAAAAVLGLLLASSLTVVKSERGRIQSGATAVELMTTYPPQPPLAPLAPVYEATVHGEIGYGDTGYSETFYGEAGETLRAKPMKHHVESYFLDPAHERVIEFRSSHD